MSRKCKIINTTVFDFHFSVGNQLCGVNKYSGTILMCNSAKFRQSEEEPRWNAANGLARRYLEAWQKLHANGR